IVVAEQRRQPLDRENRNAPQDEGCRDDPGRKEHAFDEVMEHGSDHGSRQERDDDREREVPRRGAARQVENRTPEFAPVEDYDGENGSELDDNLEDLSHGLGKIDEIAGEYEMPGRRDRQELGYTLDDAEANGLRPNMEVGQLRVLRCELGQTH